MIIKHKSKRKRNFIIYHFLVKRKPHERSDYKNCEYLPDKKIPIVMKTSFSEGKLTKQFGNPLFLRGPPLPFQLTPLFLSNFFMTPLFFKISKTRNPPAPLILWGVRGRGRKLSSKKFEWPSLLK